jgi:hypothetical protein
LTPISTVRIVNSEANNRTKQMTIITTFSALRKADACTEGYRKLADHLGGVRKYGAKTPIPVSTILDSNGLKDTLWVLSNASSGDVKQVVVQWAIDCAERVSHLYTTDDIPRKAIEAARAWLANPCGETRDAAVCAAHSAARAAYAADAATHASASAAAAAARAAYAADAATHASASAAAARAAYAARDAACAAEREWQINHLRELLNS